MQQSTPKTARPDPQPSRAKGEGAVSTTCPYCGVGCGVKATPDGGGAAAIAGDAAHPANFGRLCSKGAALGETVGLEGRLLYPQVGGARASWHTALDLVARRFSDAITAHGPDSVALYISGQLLTEDYYVANKLMKGYVGSANIDTNSRLCMASSVAGHKRAFGADTVPGVYADLEEADAIVLVGSNLAWCHPVLYQRIAAAKAARPDMRIVNIDPRRTASSDLAEIALRLAPGSDVALFNGLLNEIAARGAIDEAYTSAHISGLQEALAAAAPASLQAVAETTDLAEADLRAFYDLWIGAERVVTIYSQGVNQSTSGADKVNAILNCHLATGRIGRPGMGPFSVTGQPNAMGGREVGGLSNMLAGHLELDNADHREAVRAFWGAPTMSPKPGLKAVDLFRACADGRIKALWIMSTNPAVSMPEADAVAAAIKACEFVAVSDVIERTDTTALADVLLPATAWGEKNGTVTNSERRISRQRAFLPAPGEARPDWRIICDVATRMGWGDAFDFANPAAVFREHAALSGVAGAMGRDFDISAYADLSDADYAGLAPFQWPAPAKRSGDASTGREGGRFFAKGGFFTPDGKARMLPLAPRPPAAATDARYPLRLNTGRVRDHWHTMTRTAKSARLSSHIAEPYVEIHPADAARLGVEPASLVRLESPTGVMIARALVTDRTSRGHLFTPMHWTRQWSSLGRVDTLVAAAVDPVSGQPELKGAIVRAEPYAAAWYGFAICRREMRPDTEYWARAVSPAGWRVELADASAPEDWETFARALFSGPNGRAADPAYGVAATVRDEARGIARVALMEEGRVVGALFAAREPVAIARSHVIGLMENDAPAAPILAAR
ncbi:MAG: nitrate reductase, partial [Pseudomonadota bacterium]